MARTLHRLLATARREVAGHQGRAVRAAYYESWSGQPTGRRLGRPAGMLPAGTLD